MSERAETALKTATAGGLTRRKRFFFFVAYLFCATLFVLASLEIFLRFYVRYNPSYYTGFSKPEPGRDVQFPYGILKVNTLGFPDAEFSSVKTKPRIGYFGDSVCIGVGAGYGYRISEVLERKLPDYEHMNFAQIGSGFTSDDDVPRFLELIRTFKVDKAVYLMNLNDVLPDEKMGQLVQLSRLRNAFDWLRGQSYLYTHVRMIIKNQLVRMGYEQHGQRAYELFPDQYDNVFRQTAERIRASHDELRARGVEMIVVILPYEMQISEAAERTYRSAGIHWEEDFIDRGPQKKLLTYLEGVPCVDAYWAFVDRKDLDGSRRRNGVGEYFVYDRGDKLDWNHPNREGHRRIGDFIDGTGALKGKETGHAPREETGAAPRS